MFAADSARLMVQPSAKDTPKAGWIWVAGPRILFDVAVTCLAKSSSTPQSIFGSPKCSHAIWMAHSVGGMIRAHLAWKPMKTSTLSSFLITKYVLVAAADIRRRSIHSVGGRHPRYA